MMERGVVQVVKYLPCKCEALSSNPDRKRRKLMMWIEYLLAGRLRIFLHL
jgi:hypothetical protein